MHWMLMPFRRYADFEGRSRRMEYWMFALMNALIWGILALLTILAGQWGFWADRAFELFVVACFYSLAAFVPSIACAIRRLHDTDRSGWNLLWGLVPLIGGFIVLYFYVSDGTPGPNRFGEDPKGRETQVYL